MFEVKREYVQRSRSKRGKVSKGGGRRSASEEEGGEGFEGRWKRAGSLRGWKRRVQGEVRFKERSAGCCFGGG